MSMLTMLPQQHWLCYDRLGVSEERLADVSCALAPVEGCVREGL